MSLVELLVVTAIIAILAAILIPALSGVRRSNELSTCASGVLDALAAARQSAITMNRAVEVRVYKKDGAYFLMLFLDRRDGSPVEQLDRVFRLPVSITLSANAAWSSLLTDAVSGAEKTDARGAYRSFRFLPDGATDLAGAVPPTLTLVYLADESGSELPPNFFTLQIDMQSGIVRTFRPS